MFRHYQTIRSKYIYGGFVMDKDGYYKIDLHIHTPSSRCYKADGDLDDVYYKIIETACDNNLEVIAITDHNTVGGYEKIVQIRDRFKTDYEVLMKYGINTNEMMDLKNKIDNFERLLILPGVELTINPGIHIILICDPENLHVLKQILKNCGYLATSAGKDSTEGVKLDVKKLLEEPLLDECIVMAPHVDSDKGIYNDLKGEYRASIFKNEKLMCITCNSPIQEQKILKLCSNEPAYKRHTLLAFLNASDAHSLTEIGNKYSLVKLDSVDFKGLVFALKNPDITVKSPKIKAEIEEIIERGYYSIFERYNDDLIIEISKCICAQLNTVGVGKIILGVSETPCVICYGIDLSNSEVEGIMDRARENLITSIKFLKMSIRSEMLGNGRNIFIITLISNPMHLWNVKDEVYVYENKNIKKASVLEIEKIVRQKLIMSLKSIDRSKNNSINEVVRILNTIKNPISQFEILSKISHNSLRMFELVIVEPMKEVTQGEIMEEYFLKNPKQGAPYGNVYYILKGTLPEYPHYDDAYLRCSCPCTNSNKILVSSEMEEYKGAKIILAESGSTFILDGESWFLNHIASNFLLLTQKESLNNEISLYGLLGWLKSSPFIWYIKTKYNNTSFYPPWIFNSIPVPDIKELEPDGLIEQKVKDIIILERNFLKKYGAYFDNESYSCLTCLRSEKNFCEEGCEIDEYIDQHNSRVIEIAQEIDNILFESLGISPREIKVMSDNMTDYGLFNYITTDENQPNNIF